MIFVGGIHGVGKTMFCNRLFEMYGIKCLSASKMIAQERKEEFGKDKRIDQIETNQSLLLSALRRQKDIDEFYILDGHFCLLKKEGDIERIPFDTFRSLSPLGILVLTDLIGEIWNRLNQRDGISYDITQLQAFQDEEVEYAKRVAGQLDVPFKVYESSNASDCYHNFIKPIWGN